jgi:hypothetical protein|tara:strand:+ start:131 stop:352 length:222 start_codon:yes stop_codon:yes gene_type:complete
MNRSQPLVKVGDSDLWLQWKYCNLDGLPPEREPGSMVNHGKIPQGQYENLPEVFEDMNGTEHRIEDIHTLKSS